MNPYIHLYSGKRFYLLRPKVEDMDIESIAHGLSQIVRWTGQCKKPMTVAQHCVLGTDETPQEHKLSFLLHDAQESFVGDCAKPLKNVLPQYQEIESRIEKVIAKKFKIPYPHPQVIKEIDMRMLVTEMKWLIKGGDWKNIPFRPFDFNLEIWSMEKSKREFLKRYHRLKRK
jgi:hypothetical protein